MSAAGSVGAEASGSVVDFSDFEHQKENIQPLRRGRSAHTLAQLYAGSKEGSTLGSDSRHSLQPHRPLQPRTAAAAEAAPAAEGAGMKMTSQLQERNAQFQAEIAQLDVAESDDPLDVYHRYVGWLLEVFPQAHGHQMIIKLVEAPLKLFRDQERYRNDARYVKMWVWYTEIIADGQEAVFQFLVANKVGDSLALLYEEYAKLLEALGKTQKADEVYQLGINRKAQPLSRLQRRFDEFQRRVVAQTARSMELQQQQQQQQQQQPDGEPGPPGPSGGGQQAADENAGHSRSQQAPHRTMLGTKRSSRSVRSAAANTLPQSQRGLAAGQGPAPRPNARIAVFSDPDGAGEPKAVSAAGPWRDIGSDEGRRKENVREAVSWRGQRLEQRRGAAPPTAAAAGAAAPYAVPAAEKFTVFCDSADEDGGASDAAAAPGAALAPRVPGESSSVVGHSMLSSSSSGLLQALEAGGRAAKPRRAKAKGEERMVMPGELLFPAGDGVVQCAEEARAQLARYRFDYELWQRAEAASRAARSAYSDEDDEDQGIADESCFGASRRKSVAPSSPTINTRVAQKDMLGIWNDISDSDSDGAGVLRLRRGDARPDSSAGPDSAARGR
ncbi:protein kinase, partial [Coemansia nantahalensis]